MTIVVKSSNSMNNLKTTASHLYMKYSASSLRNLQQWRQNMFTKMKNKDGSKAMSSQDEREEKVDKGEKREKGDKEMENQLLITEEKIQTNDEKKQSILKNLYLDVEKVINNLSVHLEKIQVSERKEQTIDKKKGDIIYKTKDGRVLHAFHSCEEGKIIWNGNVYDNLKTWLAATKNVPQTCCLVD